MPLAGAQELTRHDTRSDLIKRGTPIEVPFSAPQKFIDHARFFKEELEVIQIGANKIWNFNTPNRGFGNVVVVEGENELVVIDTTPSIAGAMDFRDGLEPAYRNDGKEPRLASCRSRENLLVICDYLKGRMSMLKSTKTLKIPVVMLFLLFLASNSVAQRSRRPTPKPLTDQQRQQAIADLEELLNKTRENGRVAAQDLENAISVLDLASRALPPEDVLERLARFRSYRSDALLPTADRPLRQADPLDRQTLTLELNALAQAAPDRVTAHPAAAAFPGQVPEQAQPVTREIEIVTDRPGWMNTGIYAHPNSPYWQSTGLYAIPGQPITVTVPELAVDNGLSVRIGSHSDQLWHRDSWSRAPNICTLRPIQSEVTQAVNAFGGLVYIETPREWSAPAFPVTIAGAVSAPHYVHGETSVERWQQSIRHLPAPWAELQTDKVILTLPSEVIRDLDDPVQLMNFWDEIMDHFMALLGLPPERRRVERFVSDVQISAGYMHSGYPLMTMLDITTTMVDIDRIRGNQHHGVWGLFHEIGHNHQHADWTFAGTTEVTVNLFSLYLMEKICGLPLGGHPAVTPQARQRSMQRYFANGTPFDQWKSSPFLALAMYMQKIERFGWEPFTEVFTAYRGLATDERPRSDDQKRDQWLIHFSRAVQHDLGPFFQAWGVPVSDAARAAIADLPVWMPEDLPASAANDESP